MMDWQDALGYLFVAMPYGIAVVAALALVSLLVGMYQSPVVAVWAALLLTLWEASVREMPYVRLGLSLTAFDLIYACVALVAVLRLLFSPQESRHFPRALIVLLGVLFTSFLVGMARYGARAGVEFRNDFYFWSLCCYLTTFKPRAQWVDKLLDAWLFTSFVLCLLVWYRWLADSMGIDWVEPFWRYADATGVAFNRVAASSVALILGLAVLLAVDTLAARRPTLLSYVFIPALLLTIVFLQHRSVWVATLLPMLLLLMLRAKRTKGAVAPLVVGVASIVLVGVVLGSGLFGGAAESVAEQAARATSTTQGTFVARVEGWRELAARWASLGPQGWVIGEPFGAGYERHIGSFWGGIKMEFATHNYFVLLLLRVGAVGLFAFFLLLWTLGRAGMAPTADGDERFSPPLLIGVVLCIALYCIPYAPTPASALLFGTALSYAARGYGAVRRGSADGIASTSVDVPLKMPAAIGSLKVASAEKQGVL